MEATNPPTLGANAFDGEGYTTIYVPSSAVDDYKSADNWSTYADLIIGE